MSDKRRQTISAVLGREAVHPFPARMAPNIALRALSRGTPMRVLDPMMGSGTVLALARSRGHHAIGVDLDPLATLLSKVWTTAVHIARVRERATALVERAIQRAADLPLREAYPEAADGETRRFIRYWFDGRARRHLAALAIEIGKLRDGKTRDVCWCALSRLIIAKQAGASRAMDLSHSRPHRAFERAPIQPLEKFLEAIERVLKGCIDSKQRGRGPASAPMHGDARSLPVSTGTIDLVLTSPPYLNAIDYMRCSKFSLVWMGYSISELRSLRRSSVGAELADGSATAGIVETIVSEIGAASALRSRHQAILKRYVRDMAGCLSEVARVLRSGGRAIYVMGENTVRGTFIPNARIIRRLAADAGLQLSHTHTRKLPANRRYLPPPASLASHETLDSRMRREVVMTFRKP